MSEWKLPREIPAGYIPTKLWAERNGMTRAQAATIAGSGRLWVDGKISPTLKIGSYRLIHIMARKKDPKDWPRYNDKSSQSSK